MNIVPHILQQPRQFRHWFLLGMAIFFLSLLPWATARAAPLSTELAQAGCDTTAYDEASLTQAIACVNHAGNGAQTIQVTADIALTQPLTPITNTALTEVIIAGNSHTIDAQGNGRVLDVQSVKQLTMRDLTLRGGNVLTDVNGIEYWGGGLRYYCGEGQNCTGTLTNVTLVNNQAVEGGGFAMYCYVDTTCAATLIDSAVIGNEAQSGGGITNGFDEENFAYALQLINTVVEGNRAEIGGGIRLRGADFTAINATIRDNRATSGAGLALVSGEYFLHVNVQGSTISDNVATLRGGGIYVRSNDPNDVDLRVTNSTLSCNQVTDSAGIGGAIAISSTYGTGIALRNNTITNNRAQSGSGIHIVVDEDVFAPPTMVSFGNTVIAGNQIGSACTGVLLQDSGKGAKLFTSLGYNLDSDSSCLTPTVRQAGDLPNGNANLGPLTDNGGATLTHALLPGSQAIDAGDDALCTAAPVNGVDQRGAVRPQGAHCDMGAYERPTVAACSTPEVIVGNEAALRQAIDCLNMAPSGAYTLTLTADIAYSQPMFQLKNPALTAVVIAGHGHMLDAQGHGRVLTLSSVPALTLRDLTLTGGKLSANAASPNGGGVAFDCARDVSCLWTLRNTVVRDNQADSGGGIDYYCSAGGGGALLIQDSVLRNNRATGVGGGLVYWTDEDSQACSVTLRNTVVEGNQALDGGGLRILRPRVTISDSILRNNRATQLGGGLMARISDGYIDMNILRSTISGNHAGVSGGGVYIASPDQRFDIKFANSTISGNTVDNGMGGGLYLQETEGSLQIALINSTVTGNAASQGAGVQIFDRAEAPAYYTSTLRLTNSIIADNQGSDCTGTAEAGITFTGQRVISFGYNLDSDGSCLPPAVRQPGDLPHGTANLGPLADNGGATPTHALLTGSQAIDAGNDAVCAAEPVNGLDQRGVTRPQGNHCDIGAYEAAPRQPGAMRIQALIDGRSQLILRGDTAQWHHFDFAAPGRHEFANEPTVINGAGWFPVWPDVPDAENRDCNCLSDVFSEVKPPLPLTATPVVLHLVRSRGVTSIVQYPAAANDYTLIIEFNDNEPLGADLYVIELTPGAALTPVYVSSTSSGSVGDLHFNDEDILRYDVTSSAWTMAFDGSDVGISGDVDAFAFLDDGSLLLSLDAPATLAGVGEIDDSDIVHFVPTKLGAETAGTFAWYLDGSDLGLSADEEDIDVIDFTPDGRLLVSPSDGFDANGVVGRDEDLFVLSNATFGQTSSGTWSLYLDGSDVGVSTGRDINGTWVDPANGDIYLSTNGAYTVTGLNGDQDDIFVCTPIKTGADSACTFRAFWNGDAVGFGSERIDGIDLSGLPATFTPAGAMMSDTEPLEVLDDEPWFEGPEEVSSTQQRFFLPLIKVGQ